MDVYTEPAAHGKPEQGQSPRFLKLLDPSAGGFTFQTFDDDRARKNPALTRIVKSPPPARDELVKLNRQGAGVFVTINETDGNGRKTENITRIRAVWQEDDDGFDGAFPLQPSIVVETSPGHFHRYWLTADDWSTDEHGCADFAAVMERMVESYGSDKNAKDIARVLRLPGFLHRKSKTPHLVHIIEASGRRYSRAEITAAFPPIERAKKDKTQHREWAAQDSDEFRIVDALKHINADDRDLWVQCGMAIKDYLGDAGRHLWDDWSQQSDKYNERDQGRTWKSFKRNGISISTLFYHAQQAGWRDERIYQRPPSEGFEGFEGSEGSHFSASAASREWPEPKPLPNGLSPVDAFDNRFLPHAIAPWVMDIANRLQCPPDYVAVTAMVALGGTLGRRVGIKPQMRTDWIEIPNLWGAFVGRPGWLKSPAMGEALKPLHRLEAEASKEKRGRTNRCI